MRTGAGGSHRLCSSHTAQQHKLISELCLVASGDESHLLLRSHLTMEDLESEEFKVHDPCVAWLNGKGRWRVTAD